MFFRTASRFSHIYRNFSKTKPSIPTVSSKPNWFKRLALPTAVGLGYLAYLPYKHDPNEEKRWEQQLIEDMQTVQVEPAKPSILTRLWNGFIHVMRFMQLLIIFAPTIVLSPLMLFEKTQDYWLNLFVKAVERSGVVFIKAFQYLSHRRDIIGP